MCEQCGSNDLTQPKYRHPVDVQGKRSPFGTGEMARSGENRLQQEAVGLLVCAECHHAPAKALGAQTLRRAWDAITNRRGRRIQANPRMDTSGYRRYLQRYDRETARLAGDLAAQRINVPQWRDEMEKQIQQLHLTAEIVGAGGLNNVTPETLRRAEEKAQEQTVYLNNWARELQSAPPDALSADAIQNRARLYGSNANSTLQNARAAAMGMPALPAAPGDGTTKCMTNCKCAWRIRIQDAKAGDWDCYWRLGVAEHCTTCLARAKAWAPLKIRNFEIVTDTSNPALWR